MIARRPGWSEILITHPRLLRWFPSISLWIFPWLLLAVDRTWFFSPLLQDAYIYFGYYYHLPSHLLVFHDQYYSTRLPLILPGWIAHSLFPTLIANAFLRLLLFYTSIFGLHGILKRVYGPTTALLITLLIAGNPFFLEAMGNDYIDGFGITYTLAAMYCLHRASGSSQRRLWLMSAGGALSALIFTNLFFGYFALGIVVCDRLLTCYLLRELPIQLWWCGAGSLGLTVALMSINATLGGSPFFFLASVQAGVGLASEGFPHTGWIWIIDAAWLILPGSVVAGGLLSLAGSRNEPCRLPRMESVWGLLAVYLASLLLLERGNLGFIRYWYYADLLIPFAAIALASLSAPALRSIEPSRLPLFAMLLMLMGMLSRLLPSQWAGMDEWNLLRFLAPMWVGAVAIFGIGLLHGRSVGIACCLMGVSLASAAGKPAFRYECVWPMVPATIYDGVRAYEPIKADAMPRHRGSASLHPVTRSEFRDVVLVRRDGTCGLDRASSDPFVWFATSLGAFSPDPSGTKSHAGSRNGRSAVWDFQSRPSYRAEGDGADYRPGWDMSAGGRSVDPFGADWFFDLYLARRVLTVARESLPEFGIAEVFFNNSNFALALAVLSRNNKIVC